ncbi:protein Mis18-alpha, partial [Pipistrellus kuhlii]|uniref:protein Mis18-alpha n=1 Tax=Pipistrellus kuhlii TaxID=59472 RepID=UPI001E27028E
FPVVPAAAVRSDGGLSAPERCWGCAAPGCACGARGARAEPALPSRRLSGGSPGRPPREPWTSAWGSLGGPAPAAERSAEAAAARDEDRPLVFLCAGCRRPLGDSLSWVAGPEASCILLRSVSSNVSVDAEQILSKRENENGCILETLRCAGCALPLGHIYRSTPGHLDYKRDLFCLGVGATESYVLGSSEKHIVSEDKALGLESRAEMENSLKQMEDVLTILQAKLRDVEARLPLASSKSEL